MVEVLNIRINTRELVLKALNKFPTKKEAAKALQITDKTLYNLIDEFDLCETNGVYSNRRKVPVLCFTEM